MYQPFPDRPGICEGCDTPDYPSYSGPSAKQLVWNPILDLWLCAECRHGYSEWMGRSYPDKTAMNNSKPTFMKHLGQIGKGRE